MCEMRAWNSVAIIFSDSVPYSTWDDVREGCEMLSYVGGRDKDIIFSRWPINRSASLIEYASRYESDMDSELYNRVKIQNLISRKFYNSTLFLLIYFQHNDCDWVHWGTVSISTWHFRYNIPLLIYYINIIYLRGVSYYILFMRRKRIWSSRAIYRRFDAIPRIRFRRNPFGSWLETGFMNISQDFIWNWDSV